MIPTLPRAFTLPLLALGAGLLMAGPTAASVCVTDRVRYDLTQGAVDPAWASHCTHGNDQFRANSVLFDLTGWMMAYKIDDPLTGSPRITAAGGDAPRLVATLGADGTGAWAVDNPAGYDDMILVLKQGPTYGAFRLTTDRPMWGSWGTTGPGDGSVNALSHATLWFRPDGPTTACAGPCLDQIPPRGEIAVIPLPAAGWMLLGALGLLAGLRRAWRRRTGAAICRVVLDPPRKCP